MQHFSQEYLEKLVAEHKLVSASIAHITSSIARYSQRHEGGSISQGVQNLKARKVELEGMMDVLGEFLNS